jgi:hypothetical protein
MFATVFMFIFMLMCRGGKVTFKSNSNETLNNYSPLKSNGDEASNAVEKIVAMKHFMLLKIEGMKC